MFDILEAIDIKKSNTKDVKILSYADYYWDLI